MYFAREARADQNGKRGRDSFANANGSSVHTTEPTDGKWECDQLMQINDAKMIHIFRH